MAVSASVFVHGIGCYGADNPFTEVTDECMRWYFDPSTREAELALTSLNCTIAPAAITRVCSPGIHDFVCSGTW